MKKQCPVCKNEYETTHSSKEEAFKTRNNDSREQWLSGICGSVCWDNLFSGDSDDEEI